MQRLAQINAIQPPVKIPLAKAIGEAKSEALIHARRGQDGCNTFREEMHRLASQPSLNHVLDAVMLVIDSNLS